MFSADPVGTADKAAFFRQLELQANALMGDETDYIANAANLSALIFQLVDELNWVGFYFLRSGSELVLGPFQGKPACVRIAVGKGVCGNSVAKQETIVVADVHAFPGHIACDAASRSELVIPLRKDGRIFGVLDIDSPVSNRFSLQDRQGFEQLASRYCEASSVNFSDHLRGSAGSI
ncbi:GAF domain-containing protein [Brucella pituitosa]|uniref:GAF domain-containing protein n=1 Tax=Brucella pituitosa TaxID=571256 RepID=UPI0009A24B45|nr:GAF domain-containing protein [Brucella pituitosa]